MFWTTHEIQRLLFDNGIEVNGETCIKALVQGFMETGSDADFARWQALLTHPASQSLFIPQWRSSGWTESEAKLRYVEWTETVGSLETYARSSRSNGNGSELPVTPIRLRRVPVWYEQYLNCEHFTQVKSLASVRWSEFSPCGICCAINSRHPHMEWHHADYGRIGSDDEHLYLVPLCDECHHIIRMKGPSLDAACPEPVRRWL
jgi:hypothetical protein